MVPQQVFHVWIVQSKHDFTLLSCGLFGHVTAVDSRGYGIPCIRGIAVRCGGGGVVGGGGCCCSRVLGRSFSKKITSFAVVIGGITGCTVVFGFRSVVVVAAAAAAAAAAATSFFVLSV